MGFHSGFRVGGLVSAVRVARLGQPFDEWVRDVA